MPEQLGGRELIAALDEVVKPGEVVHYYEALGRLHPAVVPNGKDPAATLLTALHRATHYEALGHSARFLRSDDPAPPDPTPDRATLKGEDE